ncbi:MULTISPECIES: phage major capsid protein [Streptococcus]|uniref:phage major capsid protein n=1 Tax=Streptococcus TaxID=1301 RepID=UPI00143F56DA|nr:MULTISPECIES: phage major capsid protein [Streptococcus]NKN40447.1 phage major capsid protein [Streptococcus alactolyticus]NKN85171.1 phage major capsid protein [Streptococcus agalactiae]
MFDEKIKELKASINSLSTTIADKTAQVKNALEADDLEKARTIKNEIDTAKEELKTAKADLELFEATKNSGGAENKTGREIETDDMTYRDKINAFLHSKGTVVNDGLRFNGKDEVLISMNEVTPVVPKTDGVKKTDTTKVTSEELVTTPMREIKTTVDLKPFTTIYPAKKASGKYPILKKATSKMVSVAELEKNPALAKPEFEQVDWSVETYRGAIPVSQESVDDADVDLISIVAETVGQIKVNTTNSAIADVLKTFTAKTVANVDDIKKILNVDLDPAYDVAFVVSQSFYQILDTLKDGNGRYLLQDSITAVTGKVLLGKPVFVLSDEILGASGEAKAFVGDFKRGVLFADRKDLGLRWADNEIYGQYLQAVLRFGVKKVDAKAGYFVTFTPSEG